MKILRLLRKLIKSEKKADTKPSDPPRPSSAKQPSEQPKAPAQTQPKSRSKPSSTGKPKPRRERSIVVGVDFGTSSTKVMWQDLSDNQFRVFRWPRSGSGTNDLALPSTLTVRDSVVEIGLPSAELRPGDLTFESIKLCVLCQGKPTVCRCQNNRFREGHLRVTGLSDGVPANAMASVFLAHVFQEVEGSLVKHHPDDDLLLLWNIGCPMDHLDEDRTKELWERMVSAAMELRLKLGSTISADILCEAKRVLERTVVPPAGERNFFVQPEGLAAVKAFLESPFSESKTYAIVDVGAGTTEVSFFFHGQMMAELGRPMRASYLGDSTFPVGGSKIDVQLAQVWGCAIEEARKRKERGSRKIPAVPATKEICSRYEMTCRSVVKSGRLQAPSDKRFDLFLIGGGGRMKTLQDQLAGMTLPGGFCRERLLRLAPPMTLKDRHSLEESYDLIANACGLASSIEWEYYPKIEVLPIPPPPQKPPIDSEELYPK